MTLVWSVGQKITASRLNRRNPVTATTSIDRPLTSSTLVADPDVALTLKAGLTFDLLGNLGYFSAVNAAGDFQYAWQWTGTATVYMGAVGPHNAIPSGSAADGEWVWRAADTTSPSTATPYGASTSFMSARVNDRIVVGNTDITLTLLRAQQATNANATTLLGGSYITAIPVE